MQPQIEVAILVFASCVLGIGLGYFLSVYATKDGFKMGRHTVDRPVAEEGKQKTGQPVLADYDPYADAMGDNETRETVTK